MANIKKNFNFRNGVQVDDDNLLVTSTGLVGIGTTIPVEALDVRGNVIITGFTSATSQNVGFLTVATLEPTKIIGAGLSVVSGIVTATGTGIIAQEVEALNLPGVAKRRGDGTLGVRYDRLIPVLIEAVKELTAKVNSLENNK